MGHIDIYPNGGKEQPRCTIGSVVLSIISDYENSLMLGCSHQHAIELYTESINYKQVTPIAYECSDYQSFIDGKCNDCGNYGEKCIIFGHNFEIIKSIHFKKFSTKMFLQTKANQPYFSRIQLISLKGF